MKKPLKQYMQEIYGQQDKLACALEKWTSRLIGAAKAVEKKRRQLKYIRSRIKAMGEAVSAAASRKRSERLAARDAMIPSSTIADTLHPGYDRGS